MPTIDAVVNAEAVTRIPTWVTEVVAVSDVAPRIRQVTVAGGLEDFVPGAPDQFVHVLAPPAGRSSLTVDHTFSWGAYQVMPEEDRPVGAYYTIRRWDPIGRSIDLWVVLHGHDGHGEGWARTATPGDPVALWGPRDAFAPPAGSQSFVLVGDETALPAIAAILDSLDGADRATVVVVIDDAAHTIPLASAATLDITWAVRDPGQPDALLGALRDRTEMVGPSTYVWGGAESQEITAVRRHARQELGLAREQVSLTGYWRRTIAGGDR